MKYTQILLFVLKLMPYMNLDERDELFENIEKFYGEICNNKYTFLKKYNTKYKTNLNIHCIIQGEPGEFDLIYKVCDYLLEMFFNLDIEDNINKKDKDEESDNFDEEINVIPEYEEEFTSELIKVSDDENKEESTDDTLVVDEFYPQKLDKNKKKDVIMI